MLTTSGWKRPVDCCSILRARKRLGHRQQSCHGHCDFIQGAFNCSSWEPAGSEGQHARGRQASPGAAGGQLGLDHKTTTKAPHFGPNTGANQVPSWCTYTCTWKCTYTCTSTRILCCNVSLLLGYVRMLIWPGENDWKGRVEFLTPVCHCDTLDRSEFILKLQVPWELS